LNDITNIMGALFICITFLGTSNASGVQPVVAVERPVFYREVASGMYSKVPFAVAQVRMALGCAWKQLLFEKQYNRQQQSSRLPCTPIALANARYRAASCC
jgi:hypothetical protein